MFEEEINLRDYVRVVRKRKWLVMALAFVITVSVTLLTFRQIPVYQATARVLIENETPNVVKFEEVLELDTSKQDYYQTQYKILKSRSLAKHVLRKLNLLTAGASPEPEHSTFSLHTIRKLLADIPQWLGLSQEPPPASEAEQKEKWQEQTISRFLERVTITPIRGSRLVDISIASTNRKQAVVLTNTLGETYIRQNLDNKLAASKDAVRWLAKELELTQKKVADSEAALQAYKEKHEILSFEERQNIVMQKLSELSTAVNQARIKRAAIEAEYKQLQKYGTVKLESIPQVSNDPLIQELKIEVWLDRIKKIL